MSSIEIFVVIWEIFEDSQEIALPFKKIVVNSENCRYFRKLSLFQKLVAIWENCRYLRKLSLSEKIVVILENCCHFRILLWHVTCFQRTLRCLISEQGLIRHFFCNRCHLRKLSFEKNAVILENCCHLVKSFSHEPCFKELKRKSYSIVKRTQLSQRTFKILSY